jgi:Protein of unknown function (DUF3667)
MRCLNCDTPFDADQRFCMRCGQRTDTGRLSLRDTAREFMHSFVDVERSAFVFAWALLTRPGHVAREYVDGKRRRHFGPFATLAVVLGVTAFAVRFSGLQMLAQDGFSDASSQFFQQHFNWLLLAQLPLLGMFCAVLFRGERLSIPEHMALGAYLLSVRALVLSLLMPLALLTHATVATRWQVGLYWLAWYVYVGWGASQFYTGARLVSTVKGAVAAALAYAAINAIVRAGAAVYVAWAPASA